MLENLHMTSWRAQRRNCVFVLGFLASVCLAQTQHSVLTRAVVRSVTDDKGKTYVYLKIMPRSKMPFTTQTLLVRDHSLVSGLAAGDEVGFSAAHVDGENTLVDIHKIPACKRFQACPAPE